MTTHTPLTRYSATNGALPSGFIIAELHQLMGHDPDRSIDRISLDYLRMEPG